MPPADASSRLEHHPRGAPVWLRRINRLSIHGCPPSIIINSCQRIILVSLRAFTKFLDQFLVQHPRSTQRDSCAIHEAKELTGDRNCLVECRNSAHSEQVGNMSVLMRVSQKQNSQPIGAPGNRELCPVRSIVKNFLPRR